MKTMKCAISLLDGRGGGIEGIVMKNNENIHSFPLQRSTVEPNKLYQAPHHNNITLQALPLHPCMVIPPLWGDWVLLYSTCSDMGKAHRINCLLTKKTGLTVFSLHSCNSCFIGFFHEQVKDVFIMVQVGQQASLETRLTDLGVIKLFSVNKQ